MNIYNLYKKCVAFLKTAEEVVAVKNTEPFLQELSKIKDHDERIAFADKYCQKKLGEGSSRAAYQLDDKHIIKIAINSKGSAQNKSEMEVSLLGKSCINNALVADSKFNWIIFENSDKLTEKRFQEIVGFPFDHFTDALFYKFNNEDDNYGKFKDLKEIEKNSLFLCISGAVFHGNLLVGDLSKISSFRERDGKVLVVDAGLSKDVFEKWYASDSSSSSTSTPKTTEES